MIGVYKITNKKNGHCYIGQSIDIARRFKTHKNSASLPHSPTYNYPLQKAFRRHGVDNFDFEILCLCDKNELLKNEQYYYEKHSPEYNQMYPCENPVFDPKVEAKRQAIFKTEAYKQKCSKTPSRATREKISNGVRASEKHKLAHNTTEYKLKMFHIRQCGLRKNKPVRMWNDEAEFVFDSMSDCAKWLSEHTKYTSKNKVSKIKAVCDGERKSAFGFKYSYF